MAAASEPLHGSATNVVNRLIKPLRLRRESSQDPPRRAFSSRSHDPKRPKLEIPSEDSRDVAFWKQSDQGPKFAAIDGYDMAGKLIARKTKERFDAHISPGDDVDPDLRAKRAKSEESLRAKKGSPSVEDAKAFWISASEFGFDGDGLPLDGSGAFGTQQLQARAAHSASLLLSNELNTGDVTHSLFPEIATAQEHPSAQDTAEKNVNTFGHAVPAVTVGSEDYTGPRIDTINDANSTDQSMSTANELCPESSSLGATAVDLSGARPGTEDGFSNREVDSYEDCQIIESVHEPLDLAAKQLAPTHHRLEPVPKSVEHPVKPPFEPATDPVIKSAVDKALDPSAATALDTAADNVLDTVVDTAIAPAPAPGLKTEAAAKVLEPGGDQNTSCTCVNEPDGSSLVRNFSHVLSQKLQRQFMASEEFRIVNRYVVAELKSIMSRGRPLEEEYGRCRVLLQKNIDRRAGRGPNEKERTEDEQIARGGQQIMNQLTEMRRRKEELTQRLKDAEQQHRDCIAEVEGMQGDLFPKAKPQDDKPILVAQNAQPEIQLVPHAVAAVLKESTTQDISLTKVLEDQRRASIDIKASMARAMVQLAYKEHDIYRKGYPEAFKQYVASRSHMPGVDLHEEFANLWIEAGRAITQKIVKAEEELQVALDEAAAANVTVFDPEDNGARAMVYDDEDVFNVCVKNRDWTGVEAWVRDVDTGAKPDLQPVGLNEEELEIAAGNSRAPERFTFLRKAGRVLKRTVLKLLSRCLPYQSRQRFRPQQARHAYMSVSERAVGTNNDKIGRWLDKIREEQTLVSSGYDQFEVPVLGSFLYSIPEQLSQRSASQATLEPRAKTPVKTSTDMSDKQKQRG